MKTLKAILRPLMYVGTILADMFILLCVANVVMKTAIDLDILEWAAWGIGMLAVVCAFAFIRGRHKLPLIKKQPTFRIRPVRTEEEYKAALHRMTELWDAADGTPRAEELEVWAILVEDYERYFMPHDKKKPIALPQHQEPAIEASKKIDPKLN